MCIIQKPISHIYTYLPWLKLASFAVETSSRQGTTFFKFEPNPSIRYTIIHFPLLILFFKSQNCDNSHMLWQIQRVVGICYRATVFIQTVIFEKSKSNYFVDTLLQSKTISPPPQSSHTLHTDLYVFSWVLVCKCARMWMYTCVHLAMPRTLTATSNALLVR